MSATDSAQVRRSGGACDPFSGQTRAPVGRTGNAGYLRNKTGNDGSVAVPIASGEALAGPPDDRPS